DLLRFADDLLEVLGTLERLGVELVDVLRARRPRGEPAAGRDDLDAPDRRAVARRSGEDRLDVLAREAGRRDVARLEVEQLGLALGRDRRVRALVGRRAEALRERRVALARVLAGLGRDLGR